MFGDDYSCDKYGTKCFTSDAIGYYRLEDGTEVQRFCEPAWCRACNLLRNAEFLPTASQISQMLAELQESGLSTEDRDFAELIETSPEQYLAERLQSLEAQLRWRVARESPPRCLECGSTDLAAVIIDDNGFPHPGCGGTFQHVSAWRGQQSAYQILDSKGKAIDESGT